MSIFGKLFKGDRSPEGEMAPRQAEPLLIPVAAEPGGLLENYYLWQKLFIQTINC